VEPSGEIIRAIARRVARATTNRDVLDLCHYVLANSRAEQPAAAQPAETAKPTDRRAYMREYMRAKRRKTA